MKFPLQGLGKSYGPLKQKKFDMGIPKKRFLKNIWEILGFNDFFILRNSKQIAPHFFFFFSIHRRERGTVKGNKNRMIWLVAFFPLELPLIISFIVDPLLWPHARLSYQGARQFIFMLLDRLGWWFFVLILESVGVCCNTLG